MKKTVVDFNQEPPRIYINPVKMPDGDNYLVNPDMKKASKYPTHYWEKDGSKIKILSKKEAQSRYNKIHSYTNPANQAVKKVVYVHKKSVEYLEPDYLRIIAISTLITLLVTNLFIHRGDIWKGLQYAANTLINWLSGV